MIEEAEGVRRILAEVGEGPIETCAIATSVGRFAAKDSFAGVPLPGFDNSAMDGYAVRAQDCQRTGTELRITGRQPAGIDLGLRIGEGEAVRIFTGAPLPEGSDAVVMQEDTEPCAIGNSEAVRILDAPEVGEFVRRKGCDVCAGQKLIGRGEPIAVQSVGLLASQGFETIEVRTPPRVGILTTGDELARPGAILQPGQIYNSNGPMLEALSRAAGAGSVNTFHAADDPKTLRETLEAMFEKCDFVLISGGVSVGDHDHVKAVLGSLEMTSDFWRVRVKPGKPFLFGRRDSGDGAARFVFGLPGNPVSSFVTFLLFVRPAIRKWMGAGQPWIGLPTQRARAGETLENRGDRPHYLRGAIDSKGHFHPEGMQQSHALGGLARATGMVRLAGGESLPKGSEIEVYGW